MENYTKGEVEEVDDVEPFDYEDLVTMRIKPGSKIQNVLSFAMKKMGEAETRRIVWTGSGPSVTKTITCAEIMKRKMKTLHQISKVQFKRTIENWNPNVEGLEKLQVNRDVPAAFILLSKDPLDSSEPGYQPPGNFAAFWQEKGLKNKGKGDKRGKGRHSATSGQDKKRAREGRGHGQSEGKRQRERKGDSKEAQQETEKDTASASGSNTSKSSISQT